MTEDGFMPRQRLLATQRGVADRFLEVARRWRLLVRLACATSAAFALSTHLLGHQQAFFAPVAAVIVLLAGAGLRQRLLFEVILGVAVGVLVGELLILVIGRGAWQLALIVVLTTATAIFSGLKGVSLTQAANSGVLLAAVLPAAGVTNPAITRFSDALVGGFCGLAMTVLIPRNASRDLDRVLRPLLDELQKVLTQVATALRDADPEAADEALARARGLQGEVTAAQLTAANVAEVAAMSPLRWGQRLEVQRYTEVLGDIDNAIRDARVLARRSSAMLRLGEEAGQPLCEAVEALVAGIDVFGLELASGRHLDGQAALVEAARLAVDSVADQMTLNSAAVAAQVRSLAADVLLASGMTRDELDEKLNF